MPETTVQGVSLYTRDRGRHPDIFELVLTYGGIEINRPGQSTRHLPWERVSEWEIEQRRGGVLLTLRGGGSVTPLVIPKWKVDDLDLILRDITSHAARSEPEPEPEAVIGPKFEEVVSRHLAPPTIRAPIPQDVVQSGHTSVPIDPVAASESDDDVLSKLVWPSDAPLQELSDLSWPSSMGQSEEADPVPEEFVLPDIALLTSAPAVTVPPVENVPSAGMATVGPEVIRPPVIPGPEAAVRTMEPAISIVAPEPMSSTLVVMPVEGAPVIAKPIPGRAERRKRSRRTSVLRSSATFVLLSLLATAVALVLAQSAGAIHLNFLGPIA
ncbi:MAG TPA: hypothetical protein VND70_08285 [Acidimicrobiales bacterium]|nr:hypothetical protein [Acidimicrobiales bacterium]